MPLIIGPLKREDGQIINFDYSNKYPYISKMKLESLKGVIDKKIDASLCDKIALDEIQFDLKLKSERFSEILQNNIPENTDVDKLFSVNDYESFPTCYEPKIKFCVFYIKHCNQRINDIEWILKNKSKFRRFNDKQLVGLIKFREKIGPEPHRTYTIEDLLRIW